MALQNPSGQQQPNQQNQLQAHNHQPIQIFRSQLTGSAMKTQLQNALPAHVPLDRFIRIALTAVTQNPYLLQCDRTSLFGACVSAAQLGLFTDGFLGEAHLVPFKGKVQMIPGYKGLMKLARQSGQIESIEAGLIHELDEVKWVEGDKSEFIVVPRSWNNRGEITGAFAIAKFKDGGIQRAVLVMDEITKIRDAALGGKKNPSTSPWVTNFGEMAKKTALKRLLKMVQLSPDIQTATAVEDAHDRGQLSEIREGMISYVDAPPRQIDTRDEPEVHHGGDESPAEPSAEALPVESAPEEETPDVY
ncbi:MAG: recombinase RecT [Magnetococcales bacterium]|nr:recombinase RecT [Magnetococcales bacterium]